MIGKNKQWKQEINISSKNNQELISSPHTSLNIARKVISNFNINNIEKRIQDIAVSPIRITPYKLKAQLL